MRFKMVIFLWMTISAVVFFLKKRRWSKNFYEVNKCFKSKIYQKNIVREAWFRKHWTMFL